jgi:Flp pilus assembly protein TadD
LDAVNQGQYEEALTLANQALSLDSGALDAQDNKGLALFHLGRYQEAEAAFTELTQRAPGNVVYWNNLAGTLREEGKLSDAEHILINHVLSRDPNFPTAHLNLGIVYLRADRPDLAQQELTQAVKLLPPSQVGQAQDLLKQTQDPARWMRLADLMLAHQQPRAAMSALDTAQKLGAVPLDVTVERSSGLIMMGDLDRAQSLLNQIVDSGVKDARVYNNLGLVAQHRGDLQSALSYYQQASLLAPNWDVPRQNLQNLGTGK